MQRRSLAIDSLTPEEGEEGRIGGPDGVPRTKTTVERGGQMSRDGLEGLEVYRDVRFNFKLYKRLSESG